MPPPDSAVEPPNCGDFSTTRVSSPAACGGQRRGHPAAAGADDQYVDDVSKSGRSCSVMRGTAVRIAKPGDQFRRRPVVTLPRLVGPCGGQRGEGRHPGADLVRRVAGLARRSSCWPSRRSRPAGRCRRAPGTRGPSRGSAAAAGSRPCGELVRRRHHRGLPRRTLLRRSSARRARCAPARPAARSPVSAPADRGTGRRSRRPAPACPASPGNSPTAAPSARTRRSGPSGVATELMKIGITGTAAASPNSACSGCTVPWSTSMRRRDRDVDPGVEHRCGAGVGDFGGHVQRAGCVP